eukprot:TRINITY_DN10066_c0_g1_i1.p1 TRINITY_DN10066_c0_g1~~TRINITY_DN10066_c0_g1_i1.p1  ORF type:complete len:298 (-),score=88.00 TRINITY_DN10066_c0_g1_i1:75-929(-)
MEASPEEYYLSPVQDTVFSLSFALAFFVIRSQLDQSVFTPLTFWALKRWRTKQELKKEPSLPEKFRATCWKLLSYTVLLSVGIFFLKDQPFIHDTTYFWRGWPRHVHFPEPLRIFYLAELGLYIYSTFALPFEPKQKDVYVMLVHHISTVALIFISYITGFWKIGIVIMTLHDISDPLLEFSKLCLYTKKHMWLGNYTFAAFALVFLVSRCYYFPQLIWSAYSEALTFIPQGVSFLPYYPTYYTFIGLLCTLQALHLYWAYLILLMIVRALGKGELDKDARDDD